MLVASGMGGMDEMGIFYDRCLESLYPPGVCGTFCNQHTYECFLADVQNACCDEGGRNCPDGQDIPNTCPVGCAVLFPEFLETCRAHVQEQAGLQEAVQEQKEEERARAAAARGGRFRAAEVRAAAAAVERGE